MNIEYRTRNIEYRRRWILVMLVFFLVGCGKKDSPAPPPPPPPPPPPVFDINLLNDTYGAIAPFSFHTQWGPYNVHDPSIIKSGQYFYSYSTDAAYGTSVRPGLQVRKSKDLVEWSFVGWVFNTLPAQGSAYITSSGGAANQGLWAPYIIKVNNEFRLYYSLASNLPRLSVIGLATASQPEGPWTERGTVVVSKNDNSTHTNAIDPSVIITPQGEHWMYYGSAWDGIYVMKLDAATGLAAASGDKGVRVAQRGFTGGIPNGNIEGPEIIYHAQQNMYYLFIAYDWLESKYNVRVGRSSSPQGPFLDFAGKDMKNPEDNIPMIIAPYKFQAHGGWQGVAHCAVFADNGQYYMAHQGRPGIDKYYMVMHVRKLFWMPDGWPVVSPERYADVEQTAIAAADLAGQWEQIVLGYQVVPGYANEQVSANMQEAVTITLNADGKINGDANNTWTYSAPWLELRWGGGTYIDKVHVSRERDWENKKASTIVFTGLNNQGTAIWGKKK